MTRAAPYSEPNPMPDTHPALLAERAQDKPKGERTRAQIMIAACHVLDRTAPQDVTIGAICKQAGIAHGTFYIYFPDRDALLADLLLGFVAHLQGRMLSASHGKPHDRIRAATRAYAAMFEQNKGLMRCLVHHLDAFPEARAAFHRLNRNWLETVVGATQRRLQHEGRSAAITEEELWRRAHALGGMVDHYLSSLFLSGEPGIVAVSDNIEAVIETLSLIWERGLEP